MTALRSVPLMIDVASCPKCSLPRRERPACPRCGLAVDRMDAYVASREASVPREVRAAWQRTLDGWQDARRHDDFVGLVAAHQCFAWAAACYREIERKRPGDVMVDRQLARMRKSAEATLAIQSTPREAAAQVPYRAARRFLGILVIAIVVGVGYAELRRASAATTESNTVQVRVYP